MAKKASIPMIDADMIWESEGPLNKGHGIGLYNRAFKGGDDD